MMPGRANKKVMWGTANKIGGKEIAVCKKFIGGGK